jgi:hypothetical protein
MGFMSFDDFPMLPSGVWVYIIYFPNEDNSVDSVLMCNPSRMKILHWLEGSVKWYGTAGEKKWWVSELLSQVYVDTKRSLSWRE